MYVPVISYPNPFTAPRHSISATYYGTTYYYLCISSSAWKMAEQPIKCADCPKLVTPQKTWSDRNGNQGRLYVMVNIFRVPCFFVAHFFLS
jgi:hypothetical protein